MSDSTHPVVPPTLNETRPGTQSQTPPVLEQPECGYPTIPGHEVLGVLGRGGMGVVYRARQVSLNRVVALKMILAGEHADGESRRRFTAEAKAVARLQHPNIVQVYEVGQSDGRPYFSLEFVDGGSLDQRLRAGPLPPAEAADLVEALARAMHHAHQHGIVHRDLKPANILLQNPKSEIRNPNEERVVSDFGFRISDLTPKVTDFGLAKHLETQGQTQSGAVLGTPAYMAPEQAAGHSKEVGPATDVYALGAILYECLTGQPPFRGESTMATLMQVIEQVPPRPRSFNRHLDAALEAICLKCLEKEPAQRYPSALALAEDLDAYQRGEAVAADQTTRLRLLRAIMQESRYRDVLARSGKMWMAQGIIIFLVMLCESIMKWTGNDSVLAHLPFAIAGFIAFPLSIWYFRLRGGPPMIPVEYQAAKILMMTLGAVAVTILINVIRDYRPMELLPLTVLEVGLGLGAVGVILGGSFYHMPIACAVAALVLAWRPDAGPVVFGIVFGLGMFIPGWRYSRLPKSS